MFHAHTPGELTDADYYASSGAHAHSRSSMCFRQCCRQLGSSGDAFFGHEEMQLTRRGQAESCKQSPFRIAY